MVEEFEYLVKELEAKLALLGLYMVNADIGVVANQEWLDNNPDYERMMNHPSNGSDLEELLKHPGSYNIYISTIFKMSDLCWSDRVINPDRHEADREFRAIAPTEFEVTLESLKDEIMNWDEED